MQNVARLLNEMVKAGVIADYALFGAMAQMRYTEPVATMDADILVAFAIEPGLDALTPIYAFCAAHGCHPEGEAVRVGAWPVQFVPAFSRLTEEAVRNAETEEMDGVPLRIVRADYLAVLALSVGRAKDFARILALIEAGAVTAEQIEALAERHHLARNWRQFRERFPDV